MGISSYLPEKKAEKTINDIKEPAQLCKCVEYSYK